MKTWNTSAITRRTWAMLVLFVVSCGSASAEAAFSKLVVFGDSLNDSGNMVQFTHGVFPAPPSYAYGRQSNGPVWVEYLAQRLELSNRIENYACVGAMLNVRPEFPFSNTMSDTFPGLEGTDVTTQVFDFLSDSDWKADPNALYIMEGGANDFIRVSDRSVIVFDTLRALAALELYGAKHIILVNMPDWGKTPRVIMAYNLGLLPPGVTPAAFTDGAAALNQALLAYLPSSTKPGTKVTIADMFQFLGLAAAPTNPYGFTHTQELYLLFGAGSNPDEWLFWDDIHPTTRGHRCFADYVVDSLIRTYNPGQGKLGHGTVESLKGLVNAPGR